MPKSVLHLSSQPPAWLHLCNDAFQTTEDTPYLPEGEVDPPQRRILRSSSTRSLLSNAEASTSRKRGRSPLEIMSGGPSTKKRCRLPDPTEENCEENREASASVSCGVGLVAKRRSDANFLLFFFFREVGPP